MLEADVTLAETTRYPIPIMAHPPVWGFLSLFPFELILRKINSWTWVTLLWMTGWWKCWDQRLGKESNWISSRLVSSNQPSGSSPGKLDHTFHPFITDTHVPHRHSDFIKQPLILNADVLPGKLMMWVHALLQVEPLWSSTLKLTQLLIIEKSYFVPTAPALSEYLLSFLLSKTVFHSFLVFIVFSPSCLVWPFCNLFHLTRCFLILVPPPAIIVPHTGTLKCVTGPNKPAVQPIDAWTFLMLCRTRFPKAIISIGWTTQMDELSLKIGYTREMIDQMASLVKGLFLILSPSVTGVALWYFEPHFLLFCMRVEYSLLQPVTFPGEFWGKPEFMDGQCITNFCVSQKWMALFWKFRSANFRGFSFKFRIRL